MAKSKSRPPQNLKPPPQCKSILVCDSVIIDAITEKITVVGVFNVVTLAAIPGYSREFAVFMQLVNGDGLYAIDVEVRDLVDDAVLARTSLLQIHFFDRITTINLVIPVPSLPIAHAGAYELIVLADGQEIDRQQIQVVSSEESDHGEAEEDEYKGDDPEEESNQANDREEGGS